MAVIEIATMRRYKQVNKLKNARKQMRIPEYYMQNLRCRHVRGDAEEIQIFNCRLPYRRPAGKAETGFMIAVNYDDLPYEEDSEIVICRVGTLKTNYHYATENRSLGLNRCRRTIMTEMKMDPKDRKESPNNLSSRRRKDLP
ncbi:hypothetical protein FQA39_LY18765 [Lamprigera yunnana]|nr:hypothetical protein FQA39_LY18765 [Lamprigera yunnana]